MTGRWEEPTACTQAVAFTLKGAREELTACDLWFPWQVSRVTLGCVQLRVFLAKAFDADRRGA